MSITSAENKIVRSFLSNKSLSLMDHEGKEYCIAEVSISNYEKYTIDNRIFYLTPTNIFETIIDKHLISARIKYPARFGTGNANDVIKAIYDIEPWFSLQLYTKILREEQYCYVIELLGKKVNPKVLRIDLFRLIEKNATGGYDFVGGFLHCLKHFSYKNKPLSTGNEIINIAQPKELIYKIIDAFYFTTQNTQKEQIFISELEINNKHKLKVIFYYEKKTDVYFINTAHLI
jgi:hypothetical protein